MAVYDTHLSINHDEDAPEASDVEADDNDSEAGTEAEFSDSDGEAGSPMDDGEGGSPMDADIGSDGHKVQHQRRDGTQRTGLRREKTTQQTSFTGESVKNGEWVTALWSSADGFTYVSTSDGNKGFVQSKHLLNLAMEIARAPSLASGGQGGSPTNGNTESDGHKVQVRRNDGTRRTGLRRDQTTEQRSFTGKSVNNGEWVTALWAAGEFTFVRTSAGNTGFLQSKYLPNLPGNVGPMEMAKAPSPAPAGKIGDVTILHGSDTHCMLGKWHVGELPAADIFILTGDFTDNGKHAKEWKGFNGMLEKVRDSGKFKAIVLILGNHEVFHLGGKHTANNPGDIRKTLAGIKARMTVCSTAKCDVHLLLHEEINVCGLRIHGCSWWPGRSHTGKLQRGARGSECFSAIQPGIDVLLTHSPPNGAMGHWTPVAHLRHTVEKLKPGLHLYGHVHGGNNKGATKMLKKTLTVNSAMAMGHSKLCRFFHLLSGKPGGKFRIIKRVKLKENKKKVHN